MARGSYACHRYGRHPSQGEDRRDGQLSVVMARKHIERADIVLLVIDAIEPVAASMRRSEATRMKPASR